MNLLSRKLFWGYTGRIAGLPEKTVQSSRRDNPEKEEFVIGVRKTVPRVFGDEYRSALVKRVRYITQGENSAAFQNVERLVRLKVSMDRNACADRNLLGSPSELIRSRHRADVDENVAMVTKMNKMFASARGENISLSRHGLGLSDAFSQ